MFEHFKGRWRPTTSKGDEGRSHPEEVKFKSEGTFVHFVEVVMEK
jgi:hypothetical protein